MESVARKLSPHLSPGALLVPAEPVWAEVEVALAWPVRAVRPAEPVRAQAESARSVQAVRPSHSVPGHSQQARALVLAPVAVVRAELEVVRAWSVQAVRPAQPAPRPATSVQAVVLAPLEPPQAQAALTQPAWILLPLRSVPG